MCSINTETQLQNATIVPPGADITFCYICRGSKTVMGITALKPCECQKPPAKRRGTHIIHCHGCKRAYLVKDKKGTTWKNIEECSVCEKKAP